MGSHRTDVQTWGKHDSLDLTAIKLVTPTVDPAVNCGDMLHGAHKCAERPRKVFHTGFWQPLMAGDVVEEVSEDNQRAARVRANERVMADRLGFS